MPWEDPAKIISSVVGSMVCFIGLAMSCQAAPVKTAAGPKSILVLYWYNKDFSSNAIFDRSFQEVLKSAPAGSIEYYAEYLESNRFPGENQYKVLRNYLREKYASRTIAVVVAVSDVPLEYLLKYRDDLFPQAPIVFVAVRRPAANEASGPGLTGIVLGSGYKQTLDLALRLHPGTKQVFIISGTLNHDKQYETICREELQGFDGGISINYFTDLSVDELIFKTKRLPQKSVVLYIWQQSQTAQGQLLESPDVLSAITASATAPIYGVANWQVGRGVVGGYVRTFEADGSRAAEIALQIANGAQAQDIPIESSRRVPTFDWSELHRWGLKERDLPPGSIVLNRQPSFWESYKKYIVAALLALLLQAIAIIALLWQRAVRRRTQAELRKSEEKFAKAFQRSPLAFTLVSLVDYRFVEVNDTFERYTGWKRNEITGLTPLKIKLWVDTNQRTIFIEQLRREGTVRNMEIVFRKKDGEKWTGLVTSELIDLDGEPCALSLIADITEAKRAEAARHESEQRFRLVANTAPVMIWMSGPDKLCTYVNQPWLDFTGNPLEAELGEGWTKGIHPDDLTQCLNTYERAFDECRSFRMQYRIRRHDGEYRWLLDVGVPRFQADGSIAGYIGSCLDITERQLAEEALAGMGRKLIQAHEEERTRVARELHDDINQRIALISVELEHWLQHHTESGIPVDNQIRKLRVHLSELGRDVQALSHRLHSSKLDYLGLVAAAKGFCREFSEQHKVEIEFTESTVPRGMPKETSLSLFRVLQEALQNAVKHSGVRYFKVALHGTSGEVQLTVSDCGKGFDPDEAMAHRGLGLISMRERLQLVGGDLSIRSEPGEGTMVSGRAPVRQGQHDSVAAG